MNEDAGSALPLHEALSRHRVLGLLPAHTRDALARGLPDLGATAGECIANGDQLKAHLYWLIEGTVQLQDADGEAVLSLQPGELFGLAQGETLMVSAAQAETACRYTRLDALTAEALRKEVPALGYFLLSPKVANAGLQQSTGGSSVGA